MAGSSFFALLDDIATLLDDVAAMTKVAAQKASGVLGDDLALNAQQVTGVNADRELPVVFAVFKGSMLNKAILVPAALLISAFIPWAITPLLMMGGAFLCFEGFEKVAHRWLHPPEKKKGEKEARVEALLDPAVDMVAFEKEKVTGAIRTDFILSAEIIAITLGIVQESSLVLQLAVLSAIAVAMTVGVYGLVAGIVKLDDLGLALAAKEGARARIGRAILVAAPVFMKLLSIAGTIAMFLVGGGILAHGIGPVHDMFVELAHRAGPAEALVETLLNGTLGIVAGGIVVGIVTGVQKVRGAH
jgi:hypothetical protein